MRIVFRVPFLLGIFSLAAAASASAAEVVDRIAAIINTDIVLLSELEATAQPFVSRATSGLDNAAAKAQATGEVRQQVLDQMISDRLVEQAAQSLGISVADKEVDQDLARIKEQNGMTDEQLHQQLDREGMTLERLRKDLRAQRKRAKIIEIKVKPKVSVSEEDIRSYYDENFQSDDEVHVRLISLRVPPAASTTEVERVRRSALRVHTEVLGGKDFAELAKTVSEGPNPQGGGDLGWFKRGEMNPEMEQVAFGLADGALSEPVMIGSAFHIVQVTERRKRAPKDLADVRARIHGILFNRAAEKEYGRWVKDLREKGFVESKI